MHVNPYHIPYHIAHRTMIIRPEHPEENAAIYNLIKTAFETAPVHDGTEQDFANQLRLSERYIPELALVAEENGALIGQVMLTKTALTCGAHTNSITTVTELLLAPICVALPHRKKGIGSALINEGFARARKLGFNAVFLVGNPAYYSRFGFRQTTAFGIQNQSNIPDQYVMACELYPAALANKSGSISIV